MDIVGHKINNECHISLKNYECDIDIPVNHTFIENKREYLYG